MEKHHADLHPANWSSTRFEISPWLHGSMSVLMILECSLYFSSTTSCSTPFFQKPRSLQLRIMVHVHNLTVLFSFPQVHYPNDPDQPGPMYFLTPRKCAVFGINCEAFPRQVNFLIDEGMSISKGSNAVISYLKFFFNNYGLGEETAQLHCDNCSGQNKNKYVMWYLAWRCIHELHRRIELYFLIAGHTKFSPDWCFGLFKQRYRRSYNHTSQPSVTSRKLSAPVRTRTSTSHSSFERRTA